MISVNNVLIYNVEARTLEEYCQSLGERGCLIGQAPYS